MSENQQALIDDFYRRTGPCCAGCDFWRWHNSVVGDCTRSAPVSGADRIAMLGMDFSSLDPGAGQVMTRRDYHCGEFRDTPTNQRESA